MQSSHQFATIRNPLKVDAQCVLELMELCDIHDYGESDSDMEDLLNDWDQADLKTDIWLGFDAKDRLIGYLAAIPRRSDIFLSLYLHPGINEENVGKKFLLLGLDRARTHAASTQKPAKIISYLTEVNKSDRRLHEEFGFYLARHHFQMRIDMQQAPAAPVWPSEIKLREFDSTNPQYLVEIYELIQTAFGRPDREPQSFEDWTRAMTRADIFDPSLWFLALKGERIVGVCLSYIYPGNGWVRQLAVTEDERKHGLGTALLKHSFHVFWQLGLKKVGLGVEATNANAFNLYQKAGMFVKRHYLEYQLVITNRDKR